MLNMLSEQMRKRLQTLNRSPLQGLCDGEGVMAMTSEEPANRTPRTVEELFTGRQAGGERESCYLIERPATRWWPAAGDIVNRFQALAGVSGGAAFRVRTPDLARLAARLPHAWVYLDIETCGFAGMPVFLIGLLRTRGGELIVEQMLARHYGEERGILAQLAASTDPAEVLITFNGKSFDWPVLLDRAAVHRIRLPEPSFHCDLLHEARRRWGRSLPDCRLQTLELHKCGRRRNADIPSSAIPDTYHRFVQTQDAGLLKEVISHNALDLVTLAELTLHLLR